MRRRITAWLEPQNVSLPEERRLFSNRDLVNLIVPLFFEQFLLILVGIMDTLMISYAGEADVSGVTLVNMLNTVFIYLFSALASGGAVVTSQYIGNRDRKKANLSAGQLFTFSVLFAAAMMALALLFQSQLLRLLFGSVEPEVMEACETYLRISAYSYPAIAIYNTGAAICRSIGRTKITMYLSFGSNLINIIGNAIGIFVLHAGVAGVAWPSFVARVFSAAAILALCCDRRNPVFLEAGSIFCWKGSMIRRILGIAVPNGVENGIFQLVKVVLSSITALFGTVQIAANGVAQSFWSMAALIGIVMGMAFVTVVGQCMGAGDPEAADYYTKKLMRITIALSVIWNVLIFASTPLILMLYALSAEAKRYVLWLVLIHNLFSATVQPFSGPLPNALRAAGDVKFTMYVCIFATVGCRAVFSWIFGVGLGMGVMGIAFAMCLDWSVRAVLFVLRYRQGKWRTMKVI